MADNPSLVEPGIKTFAVRTLKECHNFKMKHYNMVFNIGLGIGFVVVLALLLFVKYKGKLSPEEKKRNDNKKKEYILSKIQNFKDAEEKIHQTLITGLPSWTL